MHNKIINPTGDRPVLIFQNQFTSGLFNSFPPPLRSGGNAALSGMCLVSPPLRCGENKAHETDAPSGHRSAPHYASGWYLRDLSRDY